MMIYNTTYCGVDLIVDIKFIVIVYVVLLTLGFTSLPRGGNISRVYFDVRH